MNRLVLATGAAGGGATKADESARHVRTLIVLERAITSPRLRVKIAGKVDLTRLTILGWFGLSVTVASNSLSRVDVLGKPRETKTKTGIYTNAATVTRQDHPRSSKGMWSIKLFAPSGTSSSSPSNSGVNTS